MQKGQNEFTHHKTLLLASTSTIRCR